VAVVSEPRLAPQATLSSGVVQLMVDGNAALARRTLPGLQQARAAFERAVGLDERYAPAHAGLAMALVLLSESTTVRPGSVLPSAVEHADRAVELDPAGALGWQALARAEVRWTHDWNRAELHFRRALALDPTAEEPAAHLAQLLAALGRSAEAVELSLQALRITPSSPRLLAAAGIVHHLGGRNDDALRYLEQALGAEPSDAVAALWRALCLAAAGRLDEAVEWAQQSQGQGSGAAPWVVGYVHALAGHRVAAEEALSAMTTHAQRAYVPPMAFAYLTLALGQRDGALQWIEIGVRDKSMWSEMLAVDPKLDALRGEPRFRAALASMKLGAAR
jgi:tetratricopeptide (TPR) repeat protein